MNGPTEQGPGRFDIVAWMQSSAKNGLTGVNVAASEDLYKVESSAQIVPRFAGRISQITTITAAIANFTGSRVHKTTDPNWIDMGALYAHDQAGQIHPFHIADVDYEITENDLIVAQAGNGNVAQYEAILAILTPDNIRLSPGRPVNQLPAGAKWVRGAGAATAVAGTWTPAPITWVDTFERERVYQIIGLAGWGATTYAARLRFTGGQNQNFRPGIPLGDTNSPPSVIPFFGPFGSFKGATPPNIDVLASAGDTAQNLQMLVV